MDEEGRLVSDGADQDEHLRRQQHELNRRKLALGQSVRRGLIRWVCGFGWACVDWGFGVCVYGAFWPPLTNARAALPLVPFRYVYLAVDASSAMREMDLKPDRLRHVLKVGGVGWVAWRVIC